jgi:hypothetical protein
MDEVAKSVGRTVLAGLVASLMCLLCLPDSFMGAFWLILRTVNFLTSGGVATSRHQPEPALTYPPPHSLSDSLAFFGLFDAVIVKHVGREMCILGFVLWLLLVAVAKNFTVKLLALVWLVLAIVGVMAAPLWLR